MTTPDRPDPEAIYEIVDGFVSGRVPGFPEFAARVGDRLAGSHPAVVEHFGEGRFRLDPQDALRRQAAELLDILRPRAGGTLPTSQPAQVEPGPRRRRGRPSWTSDLFWTHWHAAVEATARPESLGDVAANFRTMDGSTGIDPDYLGKLYRRFAEDQEIRHG
jgi:hypothetical protein